MCLFGEGHAHGDKQMQALHEKNGLSILCAVHEFAELLLQSVSYFLALAGAWLYALKLFVDECEIVYLPTLFQQSTNHAFLLE